MMIKRWSVLVVLMAAVIVKCHGAKILLFTAPAFSHCKAISNVGQELASRGHDVAIAIMSNFRHRECYNKGSDLHNKLRPVLFQTPDGTKSYDDMVKLLTGAIKEGEEFSTIRNVAIVDDFSRNIALSLLSDKLALEQVRNENFDLMIVDMFFMTYSFFLVPYKLGIPYVAFGTRVPDFISGAPFLPSIVPDVSLKLSDEMSFFQRLHNALYQMVFHLLIYFTIPMDVVNEFIPGLSRQDMLNIVAKSELFIYNYDTILAYPSPKMPNHIDVGGIGIQPSVPLTGEIKTFFDKSENGVVLVSFGSILETLPANVDGNLARALSRLNLDILWKNSAEGEKHNTKRVKWIPQTDILGHTKTKLFVSHCGLNSVFEALYYGIPLVCMPLFADQFYNGVRVERWGAGKTLPVLAATEEEIFQTIFEVLNNFTYKENMKRASEMYHSRPFTPRQRAAYWIEYVLKFGGAHLRSKATEISTISYLSIDLLCFVIFVMMFAGYLVYKSLLLICKSCKKSTSKEKYH